MKTLISTLFALALVPAVHAADMPQSGSMPINHAGMDHSEMAEHKAEMTGSASGSVKKIKADKGQLVIAHGPVPELQWPAMVMPFEATPEQIAAVQEGDKIRFTFVGEGMKHRIVTLEKQ